MKKDQSPLPSHIANFLDWLDVEKGLSSKKQENYARFLKKFFDWLELNKLSHLKSHELSSDHIWKYRIFLARQTASSVSKKPLKKTTQNYYLIALRSLLSYFAEMDIVSLPSEKIKLAREKNSAVVRFLNLEQLERLFAGPEMARRQGLRDRAILEAFFSTGLRLSELVALNRDQVQESLNVESLELGIVGKGGRARVVYFSKRCLGWLKKYLETRKDDEKPLFINYRTRKDAPSRLTSRSIEKIIKKYALRAGLPLNTTPHVLRHSFATDLLSKGVDIRILQEFLGHKSINATQIYTHVTSKQLKDIHKKFHGGFEKRLAFQKSGSLL